MARLRVVVAGANWVGDTLLSCARALAQLGADVTIVQTNAEPERRTRPWRPAGTSRSASLVGRPFLGMARRWALKKRFESLKQELAAVLTQWTPHVLLALADGNYPVYPDLLAEHPRVYRVGWMLDDPFTFSGPWSLGLELFDALYTVEESAVVSLRLSTGRPVRTLPLAADPAVYHRLTTQDAGPRGYPLVFVGKSYC